MSTIVTTTTVDGLQIDVIPTPIEKLIGCIFLFACCALYSFFITKLIQDILTDYNLADFVFHGILALITTAWAVGICIISPMIFERSTLIINGPILSIEMPILIRKFRRRDFSLNKVSKVRCTRLNRRARPRVLAFDYDTITYYFGRGQKEDDLKRMAVLVQETIQRQRL